MSQVFGKAPDGTVVDIRLALHLALAIRFVVGATVFQKIGRLKNHRHLPYGKAVQDHRKYQERYRRRKTVNRRNLGPLVQRPDHTNRRTQGYDQRKKHVQKTIYCHPGGIFSKLFGHVGPFLSLFHHFLEKQRIGATHKPKKQGNPQNKGNPEHIIETVKKLHK